MHHANEQTRNRNMGTWARRTWTPLSAGVLVGLGLLLGGGATAQASDNAAHPLGQCVDGKVVSGQGYVSIQGFDVVNGWIGRCAPPCDPAVRGAEICESDPDPACDPAVKGAEYCEMNPGGLGLACKHGGIDLQQEGDDDGRTVNDPVYAMANGEVLDRVGWGAEGEGVIVRHNDGSVAHYVHLEQIYVERGQLVRQGQPLGRLMDYPYNGEDNDHLHLEFRRLADPTVKSCESSCTAPTWECKGKGYALEIAGTDANTINLANHGFENPNDGLRTGVVMPEIEGWAPPGQDPMLDLRFNPNEAIANFGGGSGSLSGSAELESPYELDAVADFCDYQGRIETGGGMTYVGSEDTSFAAGVIFDLELELDQIATTTTDWVDILRGGDEDETTWRLVARYNADTATRELGFLVTVPDPEADADADTPPAPIVIEAVGALDEPQCRTTPIAETCAAAPAECPATPANCDPAPSAGVPIHCFADLGYRQWRHVAGTYDATNRVFEIKVDGEVFATGLAGGQPQAPSDTMTVYVGGGIGMKVDDVRVWDLSNLEGDKSDDAVDTFGDVPRGMENNGCQCSTGTGTGTGAGGSLLLLLGLMGLRRRRMA